jgi:hypothetical protein
MKVGLKTVKVFEGIGIGIGKGSGFEVFWNGS